MNDYLGFGYDSALVQQDYYSLFRDRRYSGLGSYFIRQSNNAWWYNSFYEKMPMSVLISLQDKLLFNGIKN